MKSYGYLLKPLKSKVKMFLPRQERTTIKTYVGGTLAKNVKQIRDVIYGEISFEDDQVRAINHPYFQRLRFIFQNGLTHLVYPGMTNNRFQHSLGASYLAGRWFESIMCSPILTLNSFKESEYKSGVLEFKSTKEAYKIISSNKKFWKSILMMSALLHDVGHCPFSHTFEKAKVFKPKDFLKSKIFEEVGKDQLHYKGYIIKKYSDKNKDHVEHEDISILLIFKIIADIDIDHGKRNVDYANFVAGLVSDEFLEHLKDTNVIKTKDYNPLKLLKLLISGFVDVDRLDYVQRDTYYAGVRYGQIEYQRIIDGLLPVFFLDQSQKSCPGYLLKQRNTQVLDHFFISLGLCYAQVMYHPKVIQIDYEFCQLLSLYFDSQKIQKQNFLELILKESDGAIINKMHKWIHSFDVAENPLENILSRSYLGEEDLKCIYSLPENMYKPDLISSYERLPDRNRVFIKNKDLIVLYNEIGKKFYLTSWKDGGSIVASKLESYTYNTRVLYKNSKFTKELNELKKKIQSSKAPKKIAKKKLKVA